MANPFHSHLPATGFGHRLGPQQSLAHAASCRSLPPAPGAGPFSPMVLLSKQPDPVLTAVLQGGKGLKMSSAPHSHLPNGETEALTGKEAHLGHRALALDPRSLALPRSQRGGRGAPAVPPAGSRLTPPHPRQLYSLGSQKAFPWDGGPSLEHCCCCHSHLPGSCALGYL